MTYVDNDDDEVVPVLKKLRMGDVNGDYVRMANGRNNHEIVGFEEGAEPLSPKKGRSWCWWFKILLIFILVASLVVVFLIWAGPYILKKYIVPILDWEIATFNPVVLGVLLFTSLALFPCILIPSSPSMWVAGITFGYGFGFLLIISGLSIGMSLPYFIGSHFRRKIHTWIEKWPEKAAIVRLAGEGDWFHQFRAVILIRISPFPFIIFNYASVATNVKYCPYICGSLVGVVPEIFVSIYSGILVRNLADATQGHQLFTTPQIICNVLGFSAAVGATAAITIYAKRALKKLQNEEETLLT